MTIQEEIQNGESRTLEYKATLPQDSQKWIKTIVAFANGAGGKFVLGVNNQREFVGLEKSVDLFELKDNIADTIGQMCDPQIMFDIIDEMVGDAQLLIVNCSPETQLLILLNPLEKKTVLLFALERQPAMQTGLLWKNFLTVAAMFTMMSLPVLM